MKSVITYISVFLAAFLIAGSIVYYSMRVFTQSADEIILPELVGKNIIYVLETLTNMGLNAKLHGTDYDDRVPRYAVISQDPKPGSTIKKGRDVDIYISKGKKENIVPDLRQTPLKQALILLEKNEFNPGHLSYTFSSQTEKEGVISQYPDPFSTAVKGSVCDLLVSLGKNPIGQVMPDLTGLKLEKASLVVNKQNLGIADITSHVDREKAFNIVLSQTPEAGSRVTGNTPIRLFVNASEINKHMQPDTLNRCIILTHSLSAGFLKHHVRVETDMLGPVLDLYDEYMKPGTDIQIWIPSGIRTHVTIFIDHHLEKAITIDPWNEDNITGDLLWESSPLQFYLPISPDLVTN